MKTQHVLLLVVALIVGVPGFVRSGLGQALPAPPPITNEYRLTLVISKPVTDKMTLFGYLGVVKAPDKDVGTLYYAPPGVIYRPKKWVELWAGLFGIYNKSSVTSNSWEMRPLGGIKFYVPNNKKINLYNFTRYEYRFINQNKHFTTQPRLRNRVGIEVPLSQKNAWTPKSFYTLADVEPIWRLDDKYMSLLRVRGGLGYVVNKTWRAEFIYHTEFSKSSKTQPLSYTGNIWRLNIKLILPRKGKSEQQVVPDIDN
ncbi:MAG TPA: DUF2490 domain-containing protein [Pyrinomonadaceae bacterium]|nr:DUF2490 domain-containing protein [Pyrinomonadaceae bacterium]